MWQTTCTASPMFHLQNLSISQSFPFPVNETRPYFQCLEGISQASIPDTFPDSFHPLTLDGLCFPIVDLAVKVIDQHHQHRNERIFLVSKEVLSCTCITKILDARQFSLLISSSLTLLVIIPFPVSYHHHKQCSNYSPSFSSCIHS